MFTPILSTIRSSRGLTQSVLSCLAQVFLPVTEGSYMETTVNGGHLYSLVPGIQTVLHWHVLKWQNNTPDHSRSHYNKAVVKHQPLFCNNHFSLWVSAQYLNQTPGHFDTHSSMLQEDKAWQRPFSMSYSSSMIWSLTPKAHCNSTCQYSNNNPKQPRRNLAIKTIDSYKLKIPVMSQLNYTATH